MYFVVTVCYFISHVHVFHVKLVIMCSSYLKWVCNSSEFISLCSSYSFRYSPIFLTKVNVEFLSWWFVPLCVLHIWNECVIVQNSYCYALSIVLGIHQYFLPKLMQNSSLGALYWWIVLISSLSQDKVLFECNRVLPFLCRISPSKFSMIHEYLWLHGPM